MRILVFDYADIYDFEKEFVNNEDDFYAKIIEKKYDVIILNFDFYPSLVEIKKFLADDIIIIFVCKICDEFIYKKALSVANYCYSYDELYKLKIRLEYLEKKVIKLKSRVFKYKNFIFNLSTNQLYQDSKPLRLTKAESDILAILIKNRNKYLSKEDIAAMSESIDSINSIKVIISNLRKLGFEIENVKNLGYKLKEEK
ncbi:response regulator transcription factor [Caminibacter pacificus]|jgi:DNA-binding response OmpR family regulator